MNEGNVEIKKSQDYNPRLPIKNIQINDDHNNQNHHFCIIFTINFINKYFTEIYLYMLICI